MANLYKDERGCAYFAGFAKRACLFKSPRNELRLASSRPAVNPSSFPIQPSIYAIPCLILDHSVPALLSFPVFANTCRPALPSSMWSDRVPHPPRYPASAVGACGDSVLPTESPITNHKPYQPASANFASLTNCSLAANHLSLLCFQSLTTIKFCNPFVLRILHRCRGCGGTSRWQQ